MGELQKRIKEALEIAEVFEGTEEYNYFLTIVEEMQKELCPPSIIDYPCEDWEARQLYEDAIKLYRKKFEKWLESEPQK